MLSTRPSYMNHYSVIIFPIKDLEFYFNDIVYFIGVSGTVYFGDMTEKQYKSLPLLDIL
jgi:hypothetical protein